MRNSKWSERWYLIFLSSKSWDPIHEGPGKRETRSSQVQGRSNVILNIHIYITVGSKAIVIEKTAAMDSWWDLDCQGWGGGHREQTLYDPFGPQDFVLFLQYLLHHRPQARLHLVHAAALP
jgi:hypothetical protein